MERKRLHATYTIDDKVLGAFKTYCADENVNASKLVEKLLDNHLNLSKQSFIVRIDRDMLATSIDNDEPIGPMIKASIMAVVIDRSYRYELVNEVKDKIVDLIIQKIKGEGRLSFKTSKYQVLINTSNKKEEIELHIYQR